MKRKKLTHYALVMAALLLLSGFSLDNAIVPREEIFSGGPPKDGIPAILKPKMVAAGRADFIKPEDDVIGIEMEGEAKAYPIKILNWHEVVNDTLSSEPIVVTF